MSVLGILGTVHIEEMRKEYNYSLKRMEELIEEFKPDIICGEVRPEDWEKYCSNNKYEGYLGPSEYRKLIIPLCEKNGIKFIPVDWFTDDLVGYDYFEGKTGAELTNLEQQFNSLMAMIIKSAKNSKIPFNSLEFNDLVEKKEDFMNIVNPELHKVCWVRRNKIMVERIKDALEGNEGKRVLCTVGAEHNYYYYKNLQHSNWEIIYPIK
ncbi:hypothetical protein SDC9_131728 [bioreactor metagenome]|uniref:Haem-binding uptake Tiki superfamily ChaN domain-containing protein n=1 Tax=bioreactor metagenome TaxID=1076179 RepID=A0A645D626_9ZZZZ